MGKYEGSSSFPIKRTVLEELLTSKWPENQILGMKESKTAFTYEENTTYSVVDITSL